MHRKVKWRLSNHGRRYVLFLVLVAPAVLLRLLTAVYPVFQTIYLSFQEINVMTNMSKFVGFKNYFKVFQDYNNHDIIYFTGAFIIASVVLQLVFGLVVATMLNAEFRGRNLVRTINLIPWAIPTIVAGLAFRWMFDDQYGLITDLLLRLTSHKYELLVHPFTARLCVILVNVWKNTPFMAVVLLAGQQSVPTELFQQGMLWFNWGMASALGVLLIIVVAIVGIIGLALFRHYDVSM